MQEYENELQEIQSEIDELRQGIIKDSRKRLTMWCIRWIIGFVLIALITNMYPKVQWLWIAGGAMALLSLCIILITSRAMLKRIGQTEEMI